MAVRRASFGLILWLGALPALAATRLDPRDLDTAVPPCRDFYAYANGGWLKTTPVPAGRERINRFSELQASLTQQQLDLLQTVAALPGEPLAALIASGLDEAALEAGGAAELNALLAPLANLRSADQLPGLIAQYQSRGLPLGYRLDVVADPDKANRTLLGLHAAPLGLPDATFYQRQDEPARELLGRYRGYVETLLALAGSSDVSADSAAVITLESRLATAPGQAVTLQRLSLRDLDKRYRNSSWKAVFKQLGLSRADAVSLGETGFFAQFDAELRQTPPAHWQAWLRFQIAHLLAPYLDTRFSGAHDRFVRAVLHGQRQPPNRAARTLDVVQRALPEAWGQHYQARYFDAATRSAVEAVFNDLRRELRDALAQAPWLQEESRAAALAKVDALQLDLRLATATPGLDALQLDPQRFAGNVLAVAQWRQRQQFALLGKPLPAPQHSPLQPVLQYQREDNRLVLSPAVAQPPLFAAGAEAALRYGALGALLGHELSHGFDLAGAAGVWSETERAAFEAYWQPLIAHYQALDAAGVPASDGQRTLRENAADLIGLRLAWRALQATGQDLQLPRADGHTPAQRFFLAWASLWRENTIDAVSVRQSKDSLQAPPRLRVLGPLALMTGFQQAFACAAPPAATAWP